MSSSEKTLVYVETMLLRSGSSPKYLFLWTGRVIDFDLCLYSKWVELFETCVWLLKAVFLLLKSHGEMRGDLIHARYGGLWFGTCHRRTIIEG